MANAKIENYFYPRFNVYQEQIAYGIKFKNIKFTLNYVKQWN